MRLRLVRAPVFRYGWSQRATAAARRTSAT